MRWRTANNNRRRKLQPRGGLSRSALERIWIEIIRSAPLIVENVKAGHSYGLPIGDGVALFSAKHPEATDR